MTDRCSRWTKRSSRVRERERKRERERDTFCILSSSWHPLDRPKLSAARPLPFRTAMPSSVASPGLCTRPRCRQAQMVWKMHHNRSQLCRRTHRKPWALWRGSKRHRRKYQRSLNQPRTYSHDDLPEDARQAAENCCGDLRLDKEEAGDSNYI